MRPFVAVFLLASLVIDLALSVLSVRGHQDLRGGIFVGGLVAAPGKSPLLPWLRGLDIEPETFGL